MATPTPTKKLVPTAPPDQFVGFWQRMYERIAPYMTSGLVGLIVIVVLVIAGWGYSSWQEGRRERSTDQLGRAMKISEAELLPAIDPAKDAAKDAAKDKEAEPDEGDIPRFKTVKERDDAVLQAVSELDKNFGSTTAAKQSTLLRAGVLYDQGKYADAEALYRKFLSEKPTDQALTALAHEDVGLCAEARGDLDGALTEFQASAQAGAFYHERSLWNQARIYTKKNNRPKAIELYKELNSKASPQSALKDEVQNRLATLEQSP